MPQMQGIFMAAVYKDATFEASDAKKRVYDELFSPLIKSAATAALQQWDKFIPNAVKQLERRFRFEPMNPPAPMPAPKTSQFRRADAEDFFGAMRNDVDIECVADWMTYQQKWPSIPSAMKGLGIGKFWTDPDVITFIFGKPDAAEQLRKYATWWADRPTSSVAVERTFGIMRTMEGKQRLRLLASSVSTELKAKVNSWIVDIVVDHVSATI